MVRITIARLALTLPILVVAACGSAASNAGTASASPAPIALADGPMHIVKGAPSIFVPAAPPASSAPTSGATVGDVLDDGTALIGGGMLGGSDGARIQRSTDGGITWSVSWSRASAAIESIAHVGRVVFASELVLDGSAAGAIPTPFLLRSDDEGQTFGELRPALPVGVAAAWWTLSFHFVSPRVGIAAPDTGRNGSIDGSGFLRTTDGGATWSAVALPARRRAANVGAILNGLTIFQAANGGNADCEGSILRSDDLGASWDVTPVLCTSVPLDAVAFDSAEHGLAAGGVPYFYTTGQRRVVYETNDGGRSWHLISSEDGPSDGAIAPITQLLFTGGRTAIARTGVCKSSGGPQCGGAVLRTTDGGATWRTVALAAMSVSTTQTMSVAVPPNAHYVSVSHDAGATWHPVGQPTSANFQIVGARPDRILAQADGTYYQTSNGRRWDPWTAPLVAGLPAWNAPASLGAGHAIEVPQGNEAIRFSSDDGESWAVVAAPPQLVSGPRLVIAAADAEHAIAFGGGDVCRTTIPGKWSAGPGRASSAYARTVAGWSASGPVALVPSLIAMEGPLAIAAGQALCGSSGVAVSADSGATWAILTLDRRPTSLAISGGVIWLLVEEASPARTTAVITSVDDGRTWTERQIDRPASSLVAAGAAEAWLSTGGGSAWHSLDGGRTWREVWFTLPSLQ